MDNFFNDYLNIVSDIDNEIEKNSIEIDYIHSQLKNKEDYYEKK